MTERSTRRAAALGCLLAAAAVAASCSSSTSVTPFTGQLPLGNWGGDSAAMIVSDTAMHIHVSCTFGDVSGRIDVDGTGHFDVDGSYTLRAFPIQVGPAVPAHFAGQVSALRSGVARATVIVTVNDTVTHQTVIRGPVVVTLGDTPRLMPCPVCRRPIVTKAAPVIRDRS